MAEAEKRRLFHLNCAVHAGEQDSQYAQVSRATLRKAIGLSGPQRQVLNSALDSTNEAAGRGTSMEVVTTPATSLGKKVASKKNKAVLLLDGATSAKKAKMCFLGVLGEKGAADGQGPMRIEGAKGNKSKDSKAKKEAAEHKPVHLSMEKTKPKSKEMAQDKTNEKNKNSDDVKSKATRKVVTTTVGVAAAVGRLADVTAESLGMLGPIVGVMDAPRLPLVEAALATGVKHMDACGFMALENGVKLSESNVHGLDADEAGALNLYTMESDLYAELNTRLRHRDRPQLRPFFPFLKLLLLARDKLPKFTGTVWRGVKSDLRRAYPKGKELYWWAFSSTTKELSTLTNPMFLGTKGVRTIFNIQVESGVDITPYSVYQGAESEAEVLLFPGTKLKVVDAMDMGHGLLQVHLREVHMPVMLLK